MRHRLLSLAAALATTLAACAHRDAPEAPPPPPARAPGDPLNAVRTGVDALLRAQAEAWWNTWTRGAPVDLDATWRGHEGLVSDETLRRVAAERDQAQGDERRALADLHAFLVGERLGRALAAPTGKVAEARAGATLAWGGKDLPDRQLQALLANEPDARRRRLLADAHAASAARWLPLVDAREAALAAEVRTLGYDGPLALAAELRGADLDALAALAQATLDETAEPYRDLVGDLARQKLALPLAEVRDRDLPRLFRAAADPHRFEPERQLDDAAATLHGLGIELRSQKNLLLDAGAAAEKVPRPIALPVEVPGSVRLSLAPVAGLEAMRALLHELGAAEYWAHVKTPVLEFRRLGPAAIPETWAQLLEALAGDPLWLAERGLEGEALRAEVRASAAHRLHLAREAAARVLFEIGRARHPERAAALWAELSQRAFFHPADEDAAPAWRTDPDPLLRAADALRARLLAAQAEVFLVERAGMPAWWRSKRAGEWLRGTWAAGSRHTPDELARAMGAKALDAHGLARLARDRAALGVATP